MRVLHVITGLAAGGAEQQLRLLVHRQPGAEVVTLTNPGSVARDIAADGTPVRHLGMRGNRDLSAVHRLVALMRAGRYDVVHTHLYRANLYGRLAARLARVPRVVATEHSLGARQIEGRRLSAPVRALYLAGERMGHRTIAVSPTVAARLRAWGVAAERITVIPNGIDAARFRFDYGARQRVRAALGLQPGTRVIVGVGRMVDSKRFDVLIRAVATLPQTVLLLVGDGPLRTDLARRAAARDTTGRVVFTGEVGDVAPLLSAADALAAPSVDEAFGCAVLEGLAAGLPVWYSAGPALDDLPPSWRGAARRLPSDPAAYAEALGAASRSWSPTPQRHLPPPAVEHYDIGRLAAEVERVYHGPAGPADREGRSRWLATQRY
jgi:glycosyltransferase involved in cell wall biosynthesis